MNIIFLFKHNFLKWIKYPLRRVRLANERGFTLIELLISLTVMGMILALLASGIQLLSNSWARTSTKMSHLEAASRAAALFKRDINNLKRVVYGEQNNYEFVFQGGSQDLFFVVIEPSYPTLPGAYFVRYSPNLNSGGAGLLRSRSLYEKDVKSFPPATPANQVLLLNDQFSYSLSYGRAERGTMSWTQNWRRQNSLPNLIKLEIKNRNTGSLAVAPVVASLRIQAEQSCFSASLKVCSANDEGVLIRSQTSNLKDRILGKKEGEFFPFGSSTKF